MQQLLQIIYRAGHKAPATLACCCRECTLSQLCGVQAETTRVCLTSSLPQKHTGSSQQSLTHHKAYAELDAAAWLNSDACQAAGTATAPTAMTASNSGSCLRPASKYQQQGPHLGVVVVADFLKAHIACNPKGQGMAGQCLLLLHPSPAGKIRALKLLTGLTKQNKPILAVCCSMQ